jgi:SAM-dependent methyltransferase
MEDERKRIVSSGYDRVAQEYLLRHGASTVRMRWLAELLVLLPQAGGGRVLDLGCGSGLPVARDVAAAGHHVLGIDGSREQILLAGENVPDGEFACADMTTADLPESSFDAVAAFYSIIHVPRSEHAHLFRRIAGWLVPGGVFVASLGSRASVDWRGEWLGTEMFFSHHDADTNLVLLGAAGLVVERAEELDQDNEDARFLWIVARKPVEAAC